MTPARRRRTKAERERLEAIKDDLASDAPGLYEYLIAAGRDRLDDELLELPFPRYRSPSPSSAERRAGVYFDVDEVDRFLRFCLRLRHIKGRRHAGRPFVPDLWQIIFVIAPVFGWRRADGTRRHREVFLEVPRKNGKSTLAAAIALYLLAADREPGAEVISGAMDRDQARAVFDVAAKMAKAAPALRRRLRVLEQQGRIVFDSTGSWYKVISSDKGGRRKHGLNLHGGIIDELHVITDRELIAAIETSTGSRDQPLLVFITTAGLKDESPVWADKHALAVKVAERAVKSAELMVCIYAADPKVKENGKWRDEATWREANPGYGTAVRPDYLANEAAKAEASPSRLNTFLRLHLDVSTESRSSWVGLDKWDRSASLVDDVELRGLPCWGGLDLSSALDLSAAVFVFPDTAGRYLDVLAKFWTPRDTLRARGDRDGVDYEVLVDEGFITAHDGETIDYDGIEADLTEFAKLYEVQALNFDRWGSHQLRTHLEDGGLPLWEMGQGFASMSPPMKELERMIVEGLIRHGGNPVLRLCLSGLAVAQDPAGNVKPDRKKSTSRIDGLVALIMAIEAWLRDSRPGRSVYEDQDLEVV